MNCLVLGCGFLGSHTAMALAHKGHEVIVLSHSANIWFSRNRPRENCELLLGDINDNNLLVKLLPRAEVVIHLAGPSVPSLANANPSVNLAQELMPTVSLLDRMKAAGKTRIIFPSTSAVYGIQEAFPIKEDAQTIPISAYGVSKLAVEKYLHFFYYTSNIQYQVLRLSNLYGPGQSGQSGQGVIGIWLSRLASGEALVLKGSGDTVRDFLFVDDAAEAIVAVVEQVKSPNILNVGSGRGTSLGEVIQAIERNTKKNIQIDTQSSDPSDIPVSHLDISKIQTLTDWRPATTLEEGIGKSWEWIVQHG